ncbi:TPA_asm: hypothetical protein vir530_00038 [dsDNA virus vir530]|jgi:hypothetical protein|nr:TPA_asm: hypothetical protein vir530_00038 [dsDNA virus vir530]
MKRESISGMSTGVYDTNSNGIVDKAEGIPVTEVLPLKKGQMVLRADGVHICTEEGD